MNNNWTPLKKNSPTISVGMPGGVVPNNITVITIWANA